MIPGPPASLGAAIPVQLARPRSVAMLAHDEDATHVRAHVVATLTAALVGVRRGPLRPAVSAPAQAAPSTATLATEESL
jgi:hypothetical protein